MAVLLNHSFPTIAARDSNSQLLTLQYIQRHPQVYVLGPTSLTHVPSQGIRDTLDIGIVKDLACPITVEAVSDTLLQPPHHVRGVNWCSYHDELQQTGPSDPLAPITILADEDLLTNYLKEVNHVTMDKHTHQVPEINRRSQLPEEMI